MKKEKMSENEKRRIPPQIVMFSLDHPRLVIIASIIAAILFALAIVKVKIDTDPENMLSETEAVRVFHKEMKKTFDMHDMVVLGVVNEKDPDGVFNPTSLARIYELTEFSSKLQWQDPHDSGKTIGVVTRDILAPSTVDNIEQAGPGSVRFEWLMPEPPKTREESLKIRDNARKNPLLYGTLLSEDGRALCIYLPITDKNLSHRIYVELKKKIATFSGDEQYHITGLPVAEDTFGVEMFKQMALSAPLAMLIIFVLMFFFFRRLILIISPLIVAFLSVVLTMGLMIALGYPVHIMSSMIPIFIMPIAVLDSVHIKSEFYERYQQWKDKRKTLEHVMSDLFTPMLYTSLTTVAGFASLALTPIPPVQIFGLFVAYGVAVAWILTVTFVPAFTMTISDKSLMNFGAKKAGTAEADESGALNKLGKGVFRAAPLILIVTAIMAVVSVIGISKIQVNDNPVKWFTKSHPIRVADDVLNHHFGGTYMAFLVLEPKDAGGTPALFAADVHDALQRLKDELNEDYPDSGSLIDDAQMSLKEAASQAVSIENLADRLKTLFAQKSEKANGDAAEVWGQIASVVESVPATWEPFKRPDVLRYLTDIQKMLQKSAVVGKSNSVSDVVMKVYKELMEGSEEYYRIPDTSAGVAQTLTSFQSSHKPGDLWHLVTPDYKMANIWVQLKSGDNKDMSRVVKTVDDYMKEHKAPIALRHDWFGLTYINVIWQERMVMGMLQSFAGSFLIVFVMMLILYRSVFWGMIAMIPMTVTVAGIYAFIGFIGKDYDMPVAVLSALTLGLAVDFAIHFLTRARMLVAENSAWSWAAVRDRMFGEPARAIMRNIIVIALGFLPLVAAPLVPYKTVGLFFSAILLLSGVATLLILPALVQVLEKILFRNLKAPVSMPCNCGLCAVTSIATVIMLGLNLHQFLNLSWGAMTIISAIIIPIMAITCGILSRRAACRMRDMKQSKGE